MAETTKVDVELCERILAGTPSFIAHQDIAPQLRALLRSHAALMELVRLRGLDTPVSGQKQLELQRKANLAWQAARECVGEEVGNG